MFGITDLATYILGTIFIILLPGPNSMYVLSVAAQRGVRAGFAGAAVASSSAISMLMTLAATGAAGLLKSQSGAVCHREVPGSAVAIWPGSVSTC